MDYTPWLVLAAVIAAFLLLKRLTLISPARARDCLERGALVLDVRTREEFRGRHLPGAVNLSLDQLGSGISRVAPDKARPILLHCLSGTRSAMAKALLKKLGYQNAFNLGSYRRAARIVGTRAPL